MSTPQTLIPMLAPIAALRLFRRFTSPGLTFTRPVWFELFAATPEETPARAKATVATRVAKPRFAVTINSFRCRAGRRAKDCVSHSPLRLDATGPSREVGNETNVEISY